MTREHPDPEDRTEPAERASAVAPDADFGDEHSGSTYAYERRGGAEREPEPESPEGLAGMDP